MALLVVVCMCVFLLCCFTSTVAVCSRRVGRPTPPPSPRGREYWGAMPAEGGCSVATIRGVQEPWRREEGREDRGGEACVRSFKKAESEEKHTGTTGRPDP